MMAQEEIDEKYNEKIVFIVTDNRLCMYVIEKKSKEATYLTDRAISPKMPLS